MESEPKSSSPTQSSSINKNMYINSLLQPVYKNIHNYKFPTPTAPAPTVPAPTPTVPAPNQCKYCQYIFHSQHNKQEKIRRIKQRNLFDKLAETLRITEDVSIIMFIWVINYKNKFHLKIFMYLNIK